MLPCIYLACTTRALFRTYKIYARFYRRWAEARKNWNVCEILFLRSSEDTSTNNFLQFVRHNWHSDKFEQTQTFIKKMIY